MKKIKNKAVIFSISYFLIFWLVPLIVLGSGAFVVDISWYLLYMTKIFPVLSIIFLFLSFKFAGFKKKEIIIFLGLIILLYFFSTYYVFVRITDALSHATFSI